MVADIFTKPLDKTSFLKFRAGLLNIDSPLITDRLAEILAELHGLFHPPPWKQSPPAPSLVYYNLDRRNKKPRSSLCYYNQ